MLRPQHAGSLANFSLHHSYLPPTYSEKEIQALRVARVHFLEAHLLCLLSDDRVLCVPLSVCPPLAAAPAEQRYQWQLIGDGRSIVWYTDTLQEHLSLRTLLDHPEAKVGDLAGSPAPFPPPGSF